MKKFIVLELNYIHYLYISENQWHNKEAYKIIHKNFELSTSELTSQTVTVNFVNSSIYLGNYLLLQ